MVDSVQLVFWLSIPCCFNGIHNTNSLLRESGNLNRIFIWNSFFFFPTNCNNRVRKLVPLMSNLIKRKLLSNRISGGFSTGRTGTIKIYKKMTQGANPSILSPLIPHPQNKGDQCFAGLIPNWLPSLCSWLRTAIRQCRNREMPTWKSVTKVHQTYTLQKALDLSFFVCGLMRSRSC